VNPERTEVAALVHLRNHLTRHLDYTIGRHAFTCDCGEEHVLYEPGDFDQIAEAVADAFAVRFERRTNEHGVAVRRVVIYGPEECDPQAPAPAPRPVIGDARYLVWSNDAGTWWGPAGHGYHRDVNHAGRYTEDAARRACAMRSWSNAHRPPEVMVLSPEADPIPAGMPVDQEMARRVEEATKAAAAAGREALLNAVQPVPVA
jgi:hypothetical protein